MLYARQCGNHSFENSIQEIRTSLAILLVNGCNKVPKRKMWLERSPEVHNAAIAGAMSRNRFSECLRYLHFTDKEQLDVNERYVKVLTLFTDLNQKWLQHFFRIIASSSTSSWCHTLDVIG